MTLLIMQPITALREISEKAVVIENEDCSTVIPMSQLIEMTTLAKRAYKTTYGKEAPLAVLIPKWLIEKKKAEDTANGKEPFPFDKTTAAWLIGNVIEWIPEKARTK